MAELLNSLLVTLGLSKSWPTYTIDDVRLHDCDASMWLVAGKSIYDVTNFVNDHPGGPSAIVKRAGGVRDCTQDLQFHSKAARKEWRKYKIGEVGKVTTGTAVPPCKDQRLGSGRVACDAGAAANQMTS